MKTGKQFVKDFIVRVSVALSLLGALFATPAGAVTLSGDGTEASPYLITSLADLVTFRDWVNATNNCAGEYYRITSDIDMVGVNWTPIGDDGSYDEYAVDFAGTFNGDGHTIRNLAIEDHAWGAALFGLVSGTIENLTIADSHVTGSSGGYALFVVIGTGDFTMRNCHAIDSYVSARSSSGLMAAYVDAGGTVAFVNCDTDGDCHATEEIGYQVGGIVGQVCYTDFVTFFGCTNNAAISGYGAIGGIVGQLGAATKTAVFTGCANTGIITVTDGAKYAGGLVGYKNMGGGLAGQTMAFTDCNNSGAVLGGVVGAALGGFVGYANGTDASFTSCGNSGAIGDDTYAAARAAGFIAWENSTADAIVFENCANIGPITGTSTGAFGVIMPTTLTITGTATVNNALTTLFTGKNNATYADAFIAGETTTTYFADLADAVAAAANGEIVTLLADDLTAELAAGQSVTIDANGHSGISITTVAGYKVVENAGTYTSVQFLSGNGTEANPYQIAKLADLMTFRDWVNAGNNCSGEYYQVTADIDMSSESNWTPISDYGYGAGDNLRFAGTFDGGNFTISHLTIASNPADLLGNTSDLMLGLFGAVGSAHFRNVRLSEVDIGVTNAAGDPTNIGICAALLGNASGASTIRNVEVVSGSVKSTENAAGIYAFGTTYMHLSNCVNRADVTGYCSGGIAGVAGRDSANTSLIESCVNYGAIASHDNSGSGVGGILGKTQNNLVRNCTNHGSVNARNSNTYAGGICGVANGGSVFEDCLNHGEVTSDIGQYGRAGGIVGSTGDAIPFTRCINMGDVTGYQGAGGIVYNVDAFAGPLAYCYNSGVIQATHGDAGGLAGGLTGQATTYSLNDGGVTASGMACMTAPTTGASVYYHIAGVLYNADGTSAGITETAACDALNTGLAVGSEFWGISAASGQAYPALFCAMPSEVWVDDNYTSGSCGGHVWSYDAFANIQAGLDAVSTGGTVNVSAGTYAENPVLDKAVTVQGSGRTTTIIDGFATLSGDGAVMSGFRVGNAASGAFISGDGCIVDDCTVWAGDTAATHTFQIYPASGAANVTIRNSRVEARKDGYTPIYVEINGPLDGLLVENCELIGTYGISSAFGAKNFTIRGNMMTPYAGITPKYGISLKTPLSGVVIERNTVSGFRNGVKLDNSLENLGDGAIDIHGNTIISCSEEEICLKRGKDVVIYGNTLVGNAGYPCVRVYNDYADLNVVRIISNSITGPLGVQNDQASDVSAEFNWWGSAQGPAGTANPGGDGASISANVSFSPWLGDGTNTEPEPGFHPNPLPIYYTPAGLVFTTQPGGGLPGSPFAQQPVVAMLNEIGGVASQFQGQVTLAVGANPGGGTLGGVTGMTALNGTAAFTDLALDKVGVGYTLLASVAGYPSVTSAVFNVSKADQTIEFPAIPDQVATGRVVLSATASSGLPVSFAVDAGPGQIISNILTFTGAGIVRVVAIQAGDAVWNPAPNVTNSVAVRDVSNLAAPQNLAASDGTFTNQVALTWIPVYGATGYEVWRATANNAGAAVCLGRVGAPGYADTSSDVLSAIRYYYWVKACNSAATSDFSNVDSGFCRLSDDPAILSGQPMVGDYDGDGKADPAVYDLATGRLYAWLSASAYGLTAPVATFQVAAADLPVTGDFDGDGLADPGVFQNAAGAWYVWRSGAGYQRLGPAVFGVNAEDAPAPVDYDGDGLADPAVYHSASGEWYAWLSSGGYAMAGPLVMGTPGEGVAAPADYDGDGKADPAVYQAAGGKWSVWLSSGGYAMSGPIAMATPGEHLAVPADYDGDGKADPAAYIPSNGVWRVWQSGNGYALLEAPLQ